MRELKTDSDFKAAEKSICLVKVRNPWGKQVSYKGPWSTGTSDWNKIEANVKSILSPDKMDDGQFYMSIEDLYKIFDEISFVHLDYNAFFSKELTFNKPLVFYKWLTQSHYGKYTPETSGK